MYERLTLLDEINRLAELGSVPATPEALQRVAPQLSDKDAREILAGVRREQPLNCGRAYFAGPGLQLHGALQIYNVYAHTSGDRLAWAFATRVQASFAAVPKNRTGRQWHAPSRWFGGVEAIDWAEINWGWDLVWDRSADLLYGYILYPKRDPAGQTVISVPWLTTATLLTLPLSYLLQCRDEPLVELIDDATQLTVCQSPLIAELLCAYQETAVATHHCGLCGGGIVRGQCQFCDTQYPAWSQPWADWAASLPASLVALLPAPHPFVSNPLEARKAEHRRWARSDFVPDSRSGAYGRERIIQL